MAVRKTKYPMPEQDSKKRIKNFNEVPFGYDPDTAVEDWQPFLSVSRGTGDLTIYHWVAEDLASFKNGVKVTITSKTAGNMNFSYFIPVASSGQTANRKY